MPETDVNKQAEAQTPKIEEANKSEQAMSEANRCFEILCIFKS